MKKSKKALFLPLLLALFLVVSPVKLEATMQESNYDVMPCWSYMNGISIGIYFNGTKGVADVTVSDIYGVTTYLDATVNVYRRTGGDWTLIASTTQSGTSTLYIDVDFTAVYGQTYKAEAIVTAYGDDGSETDTVSTQGNCPKEEDS
ncbi:MAG: hypothetical protein J6C88_03305 [Lachnospiraceae bacterium]|nr:hypothetical protein [Lachnospiraceae bacterium]